MAQYHRLADQINSETSVVFRGAFGTGLEIPVREIVVGDLINIKQGDRIPADCILTEEMNIKVDESMFDPNSYGVEKETSKDWRNFDHKEYDDNHFDNPDPFLLAGSLIMSGQGKAIVCGIGNNTRLSQMRGGQDIEVKEEETELEKRLRIIAQQMGKYALLIALFIFVSQTLLLLIKHIFSSDKMKHMLLSPGTIQDLTKFLIISICILVVAIPEGLPQAISIAMALSVGRFRQSNILIKNLSAVQTCSMIHDVCMGKTGSLTMGVMKVTRFCFGNDMQVSAHDKTTRSLIEADLQEEVRTRIINMLLGSNEGRFEPND
jgi:Ca2+-transporting ATPase